MRYKILANWHQYDREIQVRGCVRLDNLDGTCNPWEQPELSQRIRPEDFFLLANKIRNVSLKTQLYLTGCSPCSAKTCHVYCSIWAAYNKVRHIYQLLCLHGLKTLSFCFLDCSWKDKKRWIEFLNDGICTCAQLHFTSTCITQIYLWWRGLHWSEKIILHIKNKINN